MRCCKKSTESYVKCAKDEFSATFYGKSGFAIKINNINITPDFGKCFTSHYSKPVFSYGIRKGNSCLRRFAHSITPCLHTKFANIYDRRLKKSSKYRLNDKVEIINTLLELANKIDNKKILIGIRDELLAFDKAYIATMNPKVDLSQVKTKRRLEDFYICRGDYAIKKEDLDLARNYLSVLTSVENKLTNKLTDKAFVSAKEENKKRLEICEKIICKQNNRSTKHVCDALFTNDTKPNYRNLLGLIEILEAVAFKTQDELTNKKNIIFNVQVEQLIKEAKETLNKGNVITNNEELVLPEDIKIPFHLAKKLVNAIAKANPNKNKAVINRAFRKCYGQYLGKQKNLWNKLEKKMDLSNEKLGIFKSELTPAHLIPVLAESYKRDKIYGVSSMDQTNTKHACNLWASEFSVIKNKNKKTIEKTLFKCVRHGVNDPFYADENKRKSGAKNRSMEVVTAALELNREAVLKFLDGKKKPNEKYKLRISSTSLLSPSKGIGRYRKFEENQQAAFKELSSSKDLVIPFIDKHGKRQLIPVELDIATFSFGVNGFAKLKSTPGFIRNVFKAVNKFPCSDVSGWKFSDSRNSDEFNKLNLWTNEFISKHSDPSNPNMLKKIQRIKYYKEQVNDILMKKLHHKDKGDGYALPILVNLWANCIGVTPAFNCMSGKDRTGYLDASIKEALITQENFNKTYTAFSPLTHSRLAAFESALFASGNLEVQRACTGVSGYKVTEGLNKVGPIVADCRVRSNSDKLPIAVQPLLTSLSGAVNG